MEMKKMNFEQMELIVGGDIQFATSLMCTVGVLLLFTPAAILGTSPLIGCATGIYGIYSAG